MRRGEVWWANLPDPVASEPGGRRPVLIVSSDTFNQTAIRTVLIVAFSTNLKLANMPGNVFVTQEESGLPKDAVVNVTQVLTADRSFLTEHVSTVAENILEAVDDGLRLVLAL